MITLKRFQRIERAIREAGLAHIIEWTETVVEPVTAEEFAAETAYVICNSGMRQSVATVIHQRCMEALEAGRSASTVFGHAGKAEAIDITWRDRDELFAGFLAAETKVAFCDELPWIGPITSYHLAKNLGADVAKPDRHLERLAIRDRTTTERLCRKLGRLSGYRAATVDTILWRACAEGILDSRKYEKHGWRRAWRGKPRGEITDAE